MFFRVPDTCPISSRRNSILGLLSKLSVTLYSGPAVVHWPESTMAMIPAGYLAKRICTKPDWLQAPHVTDIYSLSGCVSKVFADYVEYWKHNKFWLFDSAKAIENLAQENSIDLRGTNLFYYEVYEKEFDGATWHPYEPDESFKTNVVVPADKSLEGFDVVTFYGRNLPECSPLSCNHLAAELPTNSHCLFQSFDVAETNLTNGKFNDSEPGPYRIFSVYSVNWDMKLSSTS